VAPIDSSPLTITLYSSLITTLFYNIQPPSWRYNRVTSLFLCLINYFLIFCYVIDHICIKLLFRKFPPFNCWLIFVQGAVVPTLVACWLHWISATPRIPFQTSVLFSTSLKHRRCLRGIYFNIHNRIIADPNLCASQRKLCATLPFYLLASVYRLCKISYFRYNFFFQIVF
jgi:hypothetical protein